MGILALGVRLFWRALALLITPDNAWWAGVEPSQERPIGLVVEFLLTPLTLSITLALATLAAHALLRLLGDGRGGWRTTARVFCFAAGPQLFRVFPLLGEVIGLLWTVVLAVVGLAAAHGTGRGRAAVAVLLPAAVGGALWLLGSLLGMLLEG